MLLSLPPARILRQVHLQAILTLCMFTFSNVVTGRKRSELAELWHVCVGGGQEQAVRRASGSVPQPLPRVWQSRIPVRYPSTSASLVVGVFQRILSFVRTRLAVLMTTPTACRLSAQRKGIETSLPTGAA